MSTKAQENTPSHSQNLNLYAEQEGQKHIDKILSAVESEPWGVTLLQLAWTAGPLTYIALQGGYLLGYGKTAPFALFAYFAGYTLIAGLLGLVIRIAYKAHQNSVGEKTKSNYLSATDHLFRLIKDLSDYRLGHLDEMDRKMESSTILLSNTHALPDAVALGVEELTQDTQLAQLTKKIELFRRSGLQCRVKEVIQEGGTLKQESIQNILNTPSDASYHLKMRLEGRAPSLQEGVVRTDGFLQRINQGRESLEPSAITLKDVEEFLVLLYELLNGRKIAYLNFTYTGKKKLRQSARNLEKTRARYRTARSALYADIDKLYTSLVGHQLIENVKDYDFRTKCEQIYESINSLAAQLISMPSHQSSKKKSEMIELLSGLIPRYSRLYRQYIVALRLQKQREVAIDLWQHISGKYSDRKTRFRYGKGVRGLRINQKSIFLNDEAKLVCADIIVQSIESFYRQLRDNQITTPLQVKQFILQLSDKTNRFFDISNPIVRYGIESSHATNLGSLETDTSIASRTLWTAAMVKETASNIDHAAEQLAKVLLYEYDEVIDDKAIDFLVNKFAANRSNLEKFIEEKSRSNYSLLLDIPLELTKVPANWQTILKNVKHHH